MANLGLMNAYRSQERLNGEITTIVFEQRNFAKGKRAPLLFRGPSRRRCSTSLEHGFMSNSNVTYPSFRELPSRGLCVSFAGFSTLLSTPEVLQRLPCTSNRKPIPRRWLTESIVPPLFNELITVDICRALVDHEPHLAGDRKIIRRFLKSNAGSAGSRRIVDATARRSSALFSSTIFRRYYSYLWLTC